MFLLKRILLGVVFATYLLVGPATLRAQSTTDEELSALLKTDFLKSLSVSIPGYSDDSIVNSILKVYRAGSYLPFWVDTDGTLPKAAELLNSIKDAGLHGLNPKDYFLDSIESRWQSEDPKIMAELDLLLTLALARLTSDAQVGRLDLRKIDKGLFDETTYNFRPPELDIALQPIIVRSDISNAVEEQFPGHRQYQRMKAALAFHKDLESKGGWGVVSGNTPIVPGSQGPRVLELSNRLRITGDLPETDTPSDLYNIELQSAVKNFQARHGIAVTGEVHAVTLEALKVPVEARIGTIIINMERWRWLDHDFHEDKEIYVNIAGYELFALKGSEIALRLPVIVGKAYQATPVFSGVLKYIEFNPYWNVPNSIAENEMLPSLRKNSNYLSKQHLKLYDISGKIAREIDPHSIKWKSISPSMMSRYAIKQDPGEWNVLGGLKFVFPNPYSVYLHDTANPELFNKNERAFSHGCIRVSNPRELAAFLLSTPQDPWSVERVKKLEDKGKNQNVSLPSPVPIHITYRTAWVDLDQTVNFRPDLYKRDKKLAAVLFRSGFY